MNFMRHELPEPAPSRCGKLLGPMAFARDGVLLAMYDIASYRDDLDPDSEDLLRTAAREIAISQHIADDVSENAYVAVTATVRSRMFRIVYKVAPHPYLAHGMTRN